MPEDRAVSLTVLNTDTTPGIGWFGKLPSAGDFMTRRVPAAFVGSWDHWLQIGIAHSRAQLGDQFPELYLTFPVWRFLLPASGQEAGAWCGVLMPSVDRVGRMFPLTVCQALSADELLSADFKGLEAHLARFGEAGMVGLDADSVERFEEEIAGIGPLQRGDPSRGLPLGAFSSEHAVGRWLLPGPVESSLALSAARFMLSHLGHRALWWLPSDGATAGTVRLEHVPLRAELFTTLITND